MRDPDGDLPWPDAPEQDLLVLTGGRRSGHDGLSLRFRDATVMEVDGRGPLEIAGTYDTVVIERDDLDAAHLAAVAVVAVAVLRPDGHLIVALGPATTAADVAAPPSWLRGLRWRGVSIVGDLPCAVLAAGAEEVGEPDPPVAVRLAAAAATVRALGGAAAGAGSGQATPHREANLRHRSEQALLGHLEMLADALARERQQQRRTFPAAIKAALRRRRTGRALLRIARRVRPARSRG